MDRPWQRIDEWSQARKGKIMEHLPLIAAPLLRRQIVAVFTQWGMPQAAAEEAAEVMVDTDLRGVDSHGIGMLPHYQRFFASGELDPKAQPSVRQERPSTALVDAHHSIGHTAALLAMRLAIGKAQATGVGVVGVCGSNHYGAAGYYAQMAANEGLIGLSLTNAFTPFLVPVFGRQPQLGTNPIAFSAPGRRHPPVSLDMATTTVAYGKVSIARRAGKALPEGWALNAEGRPEHDSAVAAETKLLAPLGGTRVLGGHKGYGLALMVEILCATLTGASAADRITGHFFLVIDPGAFRDPGEFRAELDALTDRMRATEPAEPGQRVLVPGDPEYAAFAERSLRGIPMTPTLLEEVREVCRESGAPFLLLP
jgi:LDH2 family malate/lactate/ureidoglycolate dehydrogenase